MSLASGRFPLPLSHPSRGNFVPLGKVGRKPLVIFERLLKWAARSAVYATFVSLIILLTGIIGSLFSSEIRLGIRTFVENSIGLVFTVPPSPTRAFWVMVIIAALLFFLRQKAVDFARQQSEGRLIDRSDSLDRLIRTLPPGDFLTTFRRLYSEVQGLPLRFSTTVEPPELEDIARSIRSVLKAVAILAYEFDGRPEETVYAANIMLFIPVNTIDKSKKDEIERRLLFTERGEELESLQGVLDLRTNLSVAIRGGTTIADPDTGLKALSLPIPKQHKSKIGRSYLLPGAPIAFCEMRLDSYHDTHTLAGWCKEKGDFSPTVIHQLKEYFDSGPGAKFRSFISIPLANLADPEAVGVLNLHSDKTHLLAEKEPVAQFVPLTTPFVFILLQLLNILRTQENEAS